MQSDLAKKINEIKGKVSKLNMEQKIIFGISCCRRQLKYCEQFEKENQWRGSKFLWRVIKEVNKNLRGNHLTRKEIQFLIDKCETLADIPEESKSIFSTPSQNTVLAICNLLDFISEKKNKDILQISQFGFSSSDFYIQMLEPSISYDPQINDIILHHPLMQAEIAAQLEDIELAKKQQNATN